MDALIKSLRPGKPSDAKSLDSKPAEAKLPEGRPAELDPAEFLAAVVRADQPRPSRAEAEQAVQTLLGYIGENPASYKSPCRDVSPSLGANDELLDYIDKPKLRELYLAWCGENGFEPIAIGAAA